MSERSRAGPSGAAFPVLTRDVSLEKKLREVIEGWDRDVWRFTAAVTCAREMILKNILQAIFRTGARKADGTNWDREQKAHLPLNGDTSARGSSS